jgi:hypothetical protein
MCFLHKPFPSQFYVHATGQGSVLGVFAPGSSMAVAISFVVHISFGLPQAFGCHVCVLEAWPSVGFLQAWPAAFIGSICLWLQHPFVAPGLAATHTFIFTLTHLPCVVLFYLSQGAAVHHEFSQHQVPL